MRLEDAQIIFDRWCDGITDRTKNLSKEFIKERKHIAINLLAASLQPKDAYFFRLYNTAQTRPVKTA